MSFYLYQIAYSADAVKAMVAKPQDRAAAAMALAESMGGKLHHLFFAFGEYDVICLVEAPDDKTMAAVAMAVAAAGTVSRAETVKLMIAAEAQEAMAMAGKATGAYRAPMAS
jgi:uncharacterized protein with GYD domain